MGFRQRTAEDEGVGLIREAVAEADRSGEGGTQEVLLAVLVAKDELFEGVPLEVEVTGIFRSEVL